MKYQLDPLSPTGVSPVQLSPTQIAMSVGGSSSSSGDTLWEANTYGALDALQPIDTTRGLVIGFDLSSTVYTSFNAASAIFNDSVNTPSTGINYFINLSYGSSLIPLGGVFLGGHARGTADSPTQTLAGDFLGVISWAGYDGSTAWPLSSANGHLVPGVWSQASADVSTALEADVWMGSLFYNMIGFETDTNAIKFNGGQLDSDITFYWDSGTAMFIDGATGNIGIGNSAPSSTVEITGNVLFTKEAARTISLQDTTTAATAGALLSITGANGSATTSGTGGGITVTAGAAQAGNSSGGALTLKGGVGVGISTGGNVDIQAGGGLTGGAVRIDPGSGVANGTVRVGTVASTRLGINVTPTARLHIGAGTASASFGQMKLDDTVLLTTPEVGVMEFDNNRLYFTHVLTRNILTATQDAPNTTTVGNITTGEDDLMTYSIPANTMPVNGDRITFNAAGTIANNANAKRIRIKYGATTILDTGAAGLPASVAASWVAQGEIIRTGATSQKCSGELKVGNSTTYPFVAYVTAAETLSGAVTLKLTGEATSTNDIVQETFSYRIN